MASPKTVIQEVQELTERGSDIDLRRGRKLLVDALRREPLDPWLHDRLGKVLSLLGQHTEAIWESTQATELDPDEYMFWHNRGSTLSRALKHEEAIASYERALALKPEDDFSLAGMILAKAAGRLDLERLPTLLRELADRANSGYALAVLICVAGQRGEIELMLTAVVRGWALHLETVEARPWHLALPLVPQAFVQDLLKGGIYIDGTFMERAIDAISLAQELLSEGKAPDRIVDLVRGILDDSEDTEEDEQMLNARAEEARAEGDFRPRPFKTLAG